MRVVHITAEAVPFAKTGGLADVAGALPAALAARGHRVLVVMPYHRPDPAAPPEGRPLQPVLEAGPYRFQAWERTVGDVAYLLLDSPRLFARPAPYGAADGDYPDNPVRFAAFARAAVLAAVHVAGGADLLHCHDWQAALVPQLLGRDPLLGGAGAGIPTVLTIHNLAYQGSFEPWVVDAAALPRELYTPYGFELYGKVNYLKGGVLAAGRVTTVSPTYAREILTPAFGCGLEAVLGARRHLLAGILNGLDTTVWDPAADPHLPAPYTARNVTAGKSACRSALARELALDDDGTPIAGMVSRLVGQKGADIVARAADEIVRAGFRLAVLGSGDPDIETATAAAARRHPGRIALRTGFDDPLAHRIYAASDLFLMPSRFEPCGLGQLIALRYGALPVVHPVGGLADTIRDLDGDPDNGNGFHLAGPTAEALADTLTRARATIAEPGRRLHLRRRAMAEDHSWTHPAAEYERAYGEVTAG